MLEIYVGYIFETHIVIVHYRKYIYIYTLGEYGGKFYTVFLARNDSKLSKIITLLIKNDIISDF